MGIRTQTRTMVPAILNTATVVSNSQQEMTSTSSITDTQTNTESTIAIAQKIAPTQIVKSRPTLPTTINNLYVLDEKMNIIGKVEDLAPGESIYSARFMGDTAYMVTFKKVDPLFVIDLKDPTKPTVAGKLKIPGSSDYLHPYDKNHIIGIGKEAIASKTGDFAWYTGVKIALFDVTYIDTPIEISKFEIGDRGTDSYALQDPKAFLFDKEKNLLVIPILLAEIDKSQYKDEIPSWAYGEYKWQGAYVFNIDTNNGIQLRDRITHSDEDENIDNNNWYYYGSKYSIKRSLYIGDFLYTISDGLIKINGLNNLNEINKINISGSDYDYPYNNVLIQ